MNLDLMSHRQRAHTEMGPRFKVPSERLEKWGIDLGIPVLIVHCVIHYTVTAPRSVTVTILGVTNFGIFMVFFLFSGMGDQEVAPPQETEPSLTLLFIGLY